MIPKLPAVVTILMMNVCFLNYSTAQNDTVKILAYNVLHYGDGCQGSNSFLHHNLKIVAGFANADILGLVKVQSIKLSASDPNGLSKPGFADSMIVYGLDSAYPGRYANAPLMDFSRAPDGDMDVLFYDQHKFGFVSGYSLCVIQEDFDLYKLYYRDPNLSITHDTTFLYFVLFHTVSGSNASELNQRDQQDTVTINGLKNIFYHFPNLIAMGDFNTRTSTEPGYQFMVNPTDTNFLLIDPPFGIDHKLSYPLDWSSTPGSCTSYLTNATRVSATIPNGCGDNGGDKDWYIHMLTSSWLAHNYDYIKYIPNSFNVIGNDGNRLDISVNDTVSRGKNTSAPDSVLNAEFELSDKYPVTEKFAITYNSTGTGPANPVNAIQEYSSGLGQIHYNNPVSDRIYLTFPQQLIGQQILLSWYDVTGRLLSSEQLIPQQTTLSRPVNLVSGLYILRIQAFGGSYSYRIIASSIN